MKPLSLLALSLLSFPVVQQAPGPEKVDVPDLRRDLEVLKRILEREALGRGSAATSDRLAALYYLAASADRGEAIYVPGDGALFLFRVTEPLAGGGEASSDGKAPDAEPTLWDRVRAEVDGKPIATKEEKRAFDPERVEKLKTRILETLGKYGGKVGQLRDDRHLTVVLRGPSIDAPAITAKVTDESGKEVDALVALGDMAAARGAFARYPTVFSGFGTSSGASTVLTVRVSRGDTAAFAAGSIDANELRRRGQIGQY